MGDFDVFVLTALAFFYTVFIGRTLLIYQKGVKAFVLGKGKKGFNRLLEPLFLVILVYWSVEVVAAATGWRISLLPDFFQAHWWGGLYPRILGSFLMVLGLVIFYLSLVSFGKSWRIGIDAANPGGLVAKGIFTYTRNPIFVSMDLLFIGVWLIYSTTFFLLAALVTVLGLHYQVLQEEKFLEAHYSGEYRAYKEKVRRYL
jgi:protein-S-isoprenylcysteine O-methyltransferase Ste14